MKKTKLQKGMTLIALIITIIVLLILAIATIGSISESGIIQYAKKTVRRTENAKIEEELNNIITSMNMDIYENPDLYSVTEEEMSTDEAIIDFFGVLLLKLEEHFKVDSTVIATGEDIRILNFEYLLQSEDTEITTMDNGNSIIIFKIPCVYNNINDLNIFIEGEIDATQLKVNSFKMDIMKGNNIYVATKQVETPKVGGNVKQVTVDGVPIPNGFYYVTGTKNTGVVISDSPDDENNNGNGNAGNQFVWVPVETSPKLEIVIDDGKIIKNVRILNFDGYDETQTVNSDYFEKAIPITANTVYEVIVEYVDGTKRDEVLYVDNCYKTIGSTAIYQSILQLFMYSNDTTEELVYPIIKEEVLRLNPDVQLDTLETKIDIMKAYIEILTDSIGEEPVNYVETRNDEENSVLKYGGFYIGRYEMSSNSTIRKGVSPYHTLTYDEAETMVENLYSTNESVECMLPTVAAWDATCSWLVRTQNITMLEAYVVANNRGNYRPLLGKDIQKKNTGSSSLYSTNNIYDLVGNPDEWSTETDGTYHTTRGGTYLKNTTLYFYLKDTPETRDDEELHTAGCRPILYIK